MARQPDRRALAARCDCHNKNPVGGALASARRSNRSALSHPVRPGAFYNYVAPMIRQNENWRWG